MSGYELALLWVAWLIAGGTPGPATLSIAGTSMNEGRRMGLVLACGILAGSAFWGIAAALGMSALMLANAWVFSTLRYAGAAYLLYLAIRSLRSAMSPDKALLSRSQSGTVAHVFSRGALIHITNPKAIFSWGAIYAITVSPDAGLAQVFRMFAFLFAGSITVFIGYALLFSTPGVVRFYQNLRRWIELVFAALFGAASLKFLTVRLE